MKEKLKKNKLLRRIVQRIKIDFSIFEFLKDFIMFKKNYMYSNDKPEKLEYRIMLLVHSIEKGFLYDEIRPFGKNKIAELIDVLNNTDDISKEKIPFLLGINVLREYAKLYEENNWTNYDEYKKTREFLNHYKNVNPIDVSPIIVDNQKISKKYNIDYYSFLNTRHSARCYKKQELRSEDIEYAINCAIKSPSACNRQMIKSYYLKDKQKKNNVFKFAQGFSGFDKDSSNIFVITFDISSFSFYGERSQGFFNSGLFAMNLCNAFHSKGIGSCFVQFGENHKKEKELKRLLGIPKHEKIAVIISAGYYLEKYAAPASVRKKINDVYIEL